MAKKPKVAELKISVPSQDVLATAAKNEDQQWKVRDDADRIKRYAELKKDKARHTAAMDHIRSEHDVVMGLDDYDSDPETSRKTTRSTTRTGSRR